MAQLTATERADMWADLTELVRDWLVERVVPELDQTLVVTAIAEAMRQVLYSAVFHCDPSGPKGKIEGWLLAEHLPELRN